MRAWRRTVPLSCFFSENHVAFVCTPPVTAPRAEDATPHVSMSFLTTAFWTADLGASFISGYHVGGLVEMRPNRVAMHYLRTWFPVDFSVVVVDWAVQVGRGVAERVSLFLSSVALKRSAPWIPPHVVSDPRDFRRIRVSLTWGTSSARAVFNVPRFTLVVQDFGSPFLSNDALLSQPP